MLLLRKEAKESGKVLQDMFYVFASRELGIYNILVINFHFKPSMLLHICLAILNHNASIK